MEYNPNKPSILVSCGDDRLVKFWDVRNLSSPLRTLSGHSHFVWCTRFNPFHDQLLLRYVHFSYTRLHSPVAVHYQHRHTILSISSPSWGFFFSRFQMTHSISFQWGIWQYFKSLACGVLLLSSLDWCRRIRRRGRNRSPWYQSELVVLMTVLFGSTSVWLKKRGSTAWTCFAMSCCNLMKYFALLYHTILFWSSCTRTMLSLPCLTLATV